MMQQGFDYAYDKRLYDRLHEGHARPVREHFLAGLDYQDHLARFLENHDEPRAATAFPPGKHEAAAVLTYLSPGLRFFHQGQFEGRRKRISPHLVRAPVEPVDTGRSGASTTRSSRCSGSPPCGTASGACSSARRRGRATGRGTASSLCLAGAGRPARPRRRELRAEPGAVLRPPAVRGPARVRPCGCGTGRAPPSTTGAATICWRAGSTSTCPRGATTSSTWDAVVVTGVAPRPGGGNARPMARVAALAVVTLLLLLAGCGSSTPSPAPVFGGKVDPGGPEVAAGAHGRGRLDGPALPAPGRELEGLQAAPRAHGRGVPADGERQSPLWAGCCSRATPRPAARPGRSGSPISGSSRGASPASARRTPLDSSTRSGRA